MSDTLQFNSLLVPLDLSPTSAAVLSRARQVVSGENPVLILVHVIDATLVEFAVSHAWGSHETVVAEMRQRAERELAEFRSAGGEDVEIDVVICEGVPFLEILQKADDFAVDAIVIGKAGNQGPIEKILFGSTAEKILRGTRVPVLVVPVSES